MNKDGKLDILIGDSWYEAPTWAKHDIRKPGRLWRRPALLQRVHDLLGRRRQRRRLARPDRHRLSRQAAAWYENPKGKDGHWARHEIWPSACNETPLYTDLFGDGRRVLVMGWQPKGKQNEGQMAWFAPGSDPTQPWEMHPISEGKGGSRAPSSSRTGSASATSTATAGKT